jgi:hypothetical protein
VNSLKRKRNHSKKVKGEYSKTAMGAIIDGSDEELRELVAEKDLGFVLSTLNLLKITYIQVEDIKNALVQSLEDKALSDEDKQTLNGLYHQLARIEQKCSVLVQISEERAIKH